MPVKRLIAQRCGNACDSVWAMSCSTDTVPPGFGERNTPIAVRVE